MRSLLLILNDAPVNSILGILPWTSGDGERHLTTLAKEPLPGLYTAHFGSSMIARTADEKLIHTGSIKGRAIANGIVGINHNPTASITCKLSTYGS